jgi:hypothetical protein
MKGVLGIDPGLEGGLALIGPDGILLEEMPVVANEIDTATLLPWLEEHRESIGMIYLEKVAPRRMQGLKSVITSCSNWGVLKGLLLSSGFSFVVVDPSDWTKEIHKGIANDDMKPKPRSRLALTQLFPRVAVPKKGRKGEPHEGLMDALLIAEYGRRKSGLTF